MKEKKVFSISFYATMFNFGTWIRLILGDKMKHKGALAEYSQERSDDLMRAYYEYLASCDYIRMPEVYNAIVNMPSARFWVSDKRAEVVVSAIMRGESVLQGMWSLKREMYEEIYRRVIALREKKPYLSTAKLCAIVVCEPAPKFYLTPGTAKIIVCKARKKWIRRKLAKFRH